MNFYLRNGLLASFLQMHELVDIISVFYVTHASLAFFFATA
jgi:hypothetical protein